MNLTHSKDHLGFKSLRFRLALFVALIVCTVAAFGATVASAAGNGSININQTAVKSLTSNDIYVIVAENGGTYYALSGVAEPDAGLKGIEVKGMESGTLTFTPQEDGITSASELEWTFTGTGSADVSDAKFAQGDGKYLSFATENGTLQVGQDGTTELSANYSSGWTIKGNASSTDYYVALNGSGPNFKSQTSSGSELSLYKVNLSSDATLASLTVGGQTPSEKGNYSQSNTSPNSPIDLGSVSVGSLSNIEVSAETTANVTGIAYMTSKTGAEESFKQTAALEGNGTTWSGTVTSPVTADQYLLFQVTAENGTFNYYKLQVKQAVATGPTINSLDPKAIAYDWTGDPGNYFFDYRAGDDPAVDVTIQTTGVTSADDITVELDKEFASYSGLFLDFGVSGEGSTYSFTVNPDENWEGAVPDEPVTINVSAEGSEDEPTTIAVSFTEQNAFLKSATSTVGGDVTLTASLTNPNGNNGKSVQDAIPYVFNATEGQNITSVVLTANANAKVSYMASKGQLASNSAYAATGSGTTAITASNLDFKASPYLYVAVSSQSLGTGGASLTSTTYYVITVNQLSISAGEPKVEVDLPQNATNIANEIKNTAVAEGSQSDVNDAIMNAVARDADLVEKLENKSGIVQALTSGGVGGATEDNVRCYYVPELAISVAPNGYVPGTSLTLDITPRYSVVATTANNPSNVELGVNAVVISEATTYPLSDVTVNIPVPSRIGGNGATVYARHAGDPWYQRTVADGVVTLLVESFSPFTVQNTVPGVASIGKGNDVTYYDSVKDAIDALTPTNSGPITLTANAKTQDLLNLNPPTSGVATFQILPGGSGIEPGPTTVTFQSVERNGVLYGATIDADGTVTVTATNLPVGMKIASLTGASWSLKKGETKTFDVTGIGLESVGSLAATSANADIAMVQGGQGIVTVTGVSAGNTTAQVVATGAVASDGFVLPSALTATCQITVTDQSQNPSGPSGPSNPDTQPLRQQLQAAVNDATQQYGETNDGTYTTLSYEAYQVALELAQAALADSSATSDELTAASQALASAIEGLLPLTVDNAKSEIEGLAADAGDLVEADYTPESWARLQEALAAANAALANADATAQELDAAAAALASAIDALQSSGSPAPQVTIPMYRLYNPYDHLHLYTADPVEVATLEGAGWVADFSGEPLWYAPSTGDGGNFAVIRFYNPWSHDHYYCPADDQAQLDSLEAAGWREDSSASWFYSAPKDSAIPVFQLFNPWSEVDTHLWTVSQEEVDALVRPDGWEMDNTAIWAASLTAE